MSGYVDAFVLPIAADKIETYRAVASQAGSIWVEYGAIAYRECVLDDPEATDLVAFPQLAGCKEGETVVVAYIEYRDRAHRDEVNAKVMADPRMNEICGSPEGMPFDCKRMAYGGFRTIVEVGE